MQALTIMILRLSVEERGQIFRLVFYRSEKSPKFFFSSFKLKPPASDKSTFRDSACVHSYSISAQSTVQGHLQKHDNRITMVYELSTALPHMDIENFANFL